MLRQRIKALEHKLDAEMNGGTFIVVEENGLIKANGKTWTLEEYEAALPPNATLIVIVCDREGDGGEGQCS